MPERHRAQRLSRAATIFGHSRRRTILIWGDFNRPPAPSLAYLRLSIFSLSSNPRWPRALYPLPDGYPDGRGCKTSSKGELHCLMRKSTVPMWERERGVPRFLCLGRVEVFGFNQRRGAGARHNSRSIHPRTQVREHSGGSRRCAHSRHHGIASPHHSHLLIPPSTVSGGSGGRSSPGSAWGACGRSTRSIRWPSGCSAPSESERVIARRP